LTHERREDGVDVIAGAVLKLREHFSHFCVALDIEGVLFGHLEFVFGLEGLRGLLPSGEFHVQWELIILVVNFEIYFLGQLVGEDD
jgi:hypothetical protein